MHYLTFDGQEHDSYDVAILVPRLDREEIIRRYIEPSGLDQSKFVAITLDYTAKKTPVKDQKIYFDSLLPKLQNLDVKYILCCDSDFFKTLAKLPKAEAYLGYVVETGYTKTIKMGWSTNVIYCPSFTGIFHDPVKTKAKITQAINSLSLHVADTYTDPGQGIIKFAAYPKTIESIKGWLQRLLDKDCDLACDIEAFSLKHFESGIGSIAFAWNQNEGIAFSVDYKALGAVNDNKEYGYQFRDEQLRMLLRDFFFAMRLRGRKLIFHNISYDATALIYQLFMDHILDTEGLLHGLDILLTHWEDTKLITYLATNSCAGNKLGLKEQAQEYAGNYAVEEIKDIRRIPEDDLLQYNLVDTLSTWFVYHKHYNSMVADQQLDIYETLFKPAVIDIVQMHLTGLPIDIVQVEKAKAELEAVMADAIDQMMSTVLVQEYIQIRNAQWVQEYNRTRKVKRVTLADAKETFNPNSAPQLQELLYEVLQLPVIDRTDSKLPATGGETLEKLKNHTSDPDVLAFLTGLIAYKEVAIIVTTFIPAFEGAVKGPDGWHYLFGFFNLGGTVSGRLSSNNPNLQNLPATGSRYAKIIKQCVKAPLGWLFVGLDFDSLEDRISALTTKDPQKLKVYTDGYDGHCLRAFFYYREQMPDIEETVASINSIAKKYKPLRQESKAPTFALTYQGTYITLMANCGFTLEKAKMIEGRYHDLYVVSDEWVEAKLQEAGQTGYVTAAFGLRVRTPLLAQTIRGTSKTPFEAAAEGRTAGNALGQSWCLLNSRAGSEFMRKVRDSKFRHCVRPCAQIHDAQYYLVRDDIVTFRFVNEHLVKAAQWQNHPDITHDQVKLGGSTSVFHPNWAWEMGVPNGASEEKILEKIQEHNDYLKSEGVLHVA